MGKPRRWHALAAGVLAALAAYFLAHASGLSAQAAWTAAITACCAIWWVTEPIPIPATSLIPFAAFPLTGVLDHQTVARAYGHTLILLLLGGFILSTAMERSGAHRRLAIGMIRLTGSGAGRRVVLGFMAASALLSMWISNTATTLMLLPVAIAVLDQDATGSLQKPVLLGIAYSASIGGLGTPVGTPPNVIFMGIYKQTTGIEVSFADWMQLGVPIVFVFVPLAWLWLTRGLKHTGSLVLPSVGPWRPAEKRVLSVFALTAAAWVTRSEPFGGWSEWFSANGAGDSTVALAAVVVMFLVPDGEGSRLLDWEAANRIPWGILILFGGGIAIADAFEATELSTSLGRSLERLSDLPSTLMIGAVCFGVTFLTEVTSNTATATLLMPVLAATARAADIDPIVLMAPAALSASCAFMLPVATAPNAIMFSTGRVTTREMATEGVTLNLVGVIIITIASAALL